MTKLITLTNLNGYVRDEIVPMYTAMLFASKLYSDQEIARINKMIIDRWSNSALNYIKTKAWKIYDPDGSKFMSSLTPM